MSSSVAPAGSKCAGGSICVPYCPTIAKNCARNPSWSIVYGRPVAGSAAAEKAAGPNPFHTGVNALNECVRSTNSFDAIMWYASASDCACANAIAGTTTRATLNSSDTEVTNRPGFLCMRDLHVSPASFRIPALPRLPEPDAELTPVGQVARESHARHRDQERVNANAAMDRRLRRRQHQRE